MRVRCDKSRWLKTTNLYRKIAAHLISEMRPDEVSLATVEYSEEAVVL